jgi:EAL domain-containing protein (putative c-di-GMP-specific phosphodiesterase class I)
MTTVAEGVETEEQLRLLAAQLCTEAQGYLFSPPVPAAHVPALLARLGVSRPPRSMVEPSCT